MEDHEIEELLGAYLLDAVRDDERSEVAEYLERNPGARAEVESYGEVVAHLAFGKATPPSGLWDRIVAELDGAAPAPDSGLSRDA